MSIVNAAVSFAISLAVFIVMAALIEAGRRRGVDPVGDIARVLSPDVPESAEEPV